MRRCGAELPDRIGPAVLITHSMSFPIAVVVAHTSPFASFGHGVAEYLVQAGADAEPLRLPEMGITGSGHLPMGEKNSDEVAETPMAWLDKQPATTKEDDR